MNKDLYVDDIEEFVDYIIADVEHDEDVFVEIIAKFDVAKEILKYIISYGDVDFEFLEIESPMTGDYDDEFIMSLWMNDGVIQVGCEKLKGENGDYTTPCADITYLFDDCSSKIIPLCEGSELYFVNIEDGCDCDEECCGCCPCDCHSNEYYSFSFYTDDFGF